MHHRELTCTVIPTVRVLQVYNYILCKNKCVCVCRYARLPVYAICPNVTTHERVILFRRPGQPWLFLPEIKCVVSGVKNTKIHCAIQ